MNVFAVLVVIFAVVFLGGAFCLCVAALWRCSRYWRRRGEAGHTTLP